MNAPTFLKEKVALFQDFSAERLQQLVDGSRLASFEANQAIAHRGEEATHFGVVLSGTVGAEVVLDAPTKVDRFVGKPYQPETLLELVRRVLGEREAA